MYIVQTCKYIVQTCMYMYKHVYTRFESYKHVHTMYKPVYASNSSKFCVADVPCTDGYIHFMNCTDIDEQCTYIVQLCTYTDISFRLQLFYSPGWLACWLGLAAAWCHTYSSSSTLV